MLNPAYLHLLLTHLPLLGTLFGLFLLVVGFVQSNQGLQRLSLWTFLGAGVSAALTYWTGEGASKVLMKAVPTTSMDLGDQHAEVAILALTAALILAAVALAGLVLYRRSKPLSGSFIALTFVLALGTSLTMGWTGHLGAKIRHTEIHAVPQQQAVQGH